MVRSQDNLLLLDQLDANSFLRSYRTSASPGQSIYKSNPFGMDHQSTGVLNKPFF